MHPFRKCALIILTVIFCVKGMSYVSEYGGIEKLPTETDEIHFEDWHIQCRQAHILASACPTAPDDCQLCEYNGLLNFPHLPDMVFPNNFLSLTHKNGGVIEFTPIESLKCVDIKRAPVQVSCAEEWQETRPVTEQQKKSFDWTFNTDFKGTLKNGFEAEPSTERINLDILRRPEKILFYKDITLFEDELHDHGISSSSVKIRVMPSGWFVLLRYFLRVDNVMTKINDTRMFFQSNSQSVLIEYTSKEGEIPELKLPTAILIDPNLLSQRLPAKLTELKKITLNCEKKS